MSLINKYNVKKVLQDILLKDRSPQTIEIIDLQFYAIFDEIKKDFDLNCFDRLEHAWTLENPSGINSVMFFCHGSKYAQVQYGVELELNGESCVGMSWDQLLYNIDNLGVVINKRFVVVK